MNTTLRTILLGSILLTAPTIHAATLTWDATAGGTIDDGGGSWLDAGLWNDGTPGATWTSGDNAVFGSGGTGGAVTLAGPTTVGSLTFNTFTGTYTLGTSGQAITINTGITMNAGAGAVTFNSPVTLGAAQSWINNSASQLTVGTEAISNGGFLLTIGGSGNTTVSGSIGGSGGLTTAGSGTLTLTGANNYTGATAINLGTLVLSDANGSIANSSAISVGTAAGSAGVLTLDNSGTNNADRVGSGSMTFRNGSLNFIGNTSSASLETIGAITAGTGNNQINLSGGSAGQVATLTSTAATITRTAGATLNIVADNTSQQFNLTGGTAGMLNKGIFFNGADFAYLDAAGNLRAPVYGTDAGFSAVDTVANNTHVKLTSTVASQGAATLNSLNLAGATVGITALTGNLTFNNSAVNGGIIKSGGGAAQIGTAGNAFDIIGQTGGELVFNTVAAADNLTLNIGITATTTALTKTGAGTLTFTANRNVAYTGATTINAGTLVLNTLSADGFVSAVTVNNGGTLKLGAANKMVNTSVITVNNGGTFDLNGFGDTIARTTGTGSVTNTGAIQTLTMTGGGTNTVGNSFSGAINLSIQGTATLTLSGTNTYTGSTTIGAAAVSGTQLKSGVTNALPIGTSVRVDGTGSYTGWDLNGFDQTIVGLTLHSNNGGGVAQVTGSGSKLTLTGGASALSIDNNNNPAALISVSTLDLNGATQTVTNSSNTGALTISSVIQNGALTTTGTGTVALTNASNTYAGNTTIGSTGTLQIGGGGALGSGSYAGNISFSAAGRLLYSSTADQTLSGAITGATGILTKDTGTLSTLTLSGTAANTYAGLTTVTAGILQLDKSTNVNAFGGNLVLGAANNTIARAQYTGAGNNMIANAATVTINGRSRFDFNGGTDTIGNVTIVSTGASSDANSIINTAGGGNLTIGTLGITPVAGLTTVLNAGTGTITLGGDVTFTAATTGKARITGTELALGAANRTFTVALGTGANEDLLIDAAITGASRSLTKAGTGRLTLSGDNTYGGGTNVNAGSLLLGANDRLANAGAVTVGGGIFDIQTFSETVGAVTLTSGTITGSTGVLTGSSYNVQSGTVSAILAGTAVALTKTNSGTVTLSGVNTYSGATTLTGGTLSVGVTENLGDAASNLVFNGGTLQITGTTLANFSTIGHTVAFNSGKTVGLDINAGAHTFTADQVLNQGTGGLTKAGAGTLVLDQVNTFTGNTSITAGTLQISSAGSLNSGAYAGLIANAGTLKYSSSANQTLSGAISGTGSLIKDTSSASTLTLSAANTFSGTTTVSAGTLTLSHASALQNSTFDTTASIAGDASNGLKTTVTTLTLGGLTGNKDLADVFTTTSGGYSSVTTLTLNPGSGVTNSYSGAISNGAMNLTKTGAGTQTLSGTISNTGATTVSAGLLRITGSTSASSAVGVSGGALGGTGTVGGAVTLSSTGGINLQDGVVGDLTLSSTLDITGATGANSLKFDLGNATNTTDRILVGGATSITNAGAAVISLNQLGGSAGRNAAGTYTLIQGTTSMAALGQFALATTKSFGQTFSLGVVGNNLQLTIAQSASGPAAAFWSGATDGSWNTLSNWKTTVSSNVTVGSAPDYTTNVTFGTTTPVQGNLTTTLGSDQNINSLTFAIPAAGGITIGGANMLTLESSGTAITSSNTSGTNTISANVGLAASQTWSVANGGTLTVSGAVSDFGAGNTLTKSGGGTLNISGILGGATGVTVNTGTLALGNASNSFTGDITINGGTLGTINFGDGAAVYGSGSNVVFTGNGTLNAPNTSGGATLNKNLTVNPGVSANISTASAAFSANFTGVFGGSGTLNLINSNGSLTLSNPSNTFTGTMVLNNTGSVSVNSFADGTNPIQFTAASSFIFSGAAATSTSLLFNSRQIVLGASGTIANNNTDATKTFIVNTDLGFSGAGARTLTLDGSNTGANAFNGNIANNGGSAVAVTKSGTGTWTISGNMSNTGGVIINAGGALTLSGTNTYSGQTQFSGVGAQLVLAGSQAASPNTTFVMNTNASSASSTLKLLDDTGNVNGGTATFAGTYTLQSNNTAGATNTFFVGNNNTANGGTSSGTTTGSTITIGTLNWNTVAAGTTSVGNIPIQGANGYRLQINNVVLYNGSSMAGGQTNNTTFNPTTANVTLGSVTMATGNTVSGAIPFLILDGTSSDNQITGAISNASDVGTTLRPVNLTKSNTSTWTLAGTNTYTGTTTISGGALMLDSANALPGGIGTTGGTSALTLSGGVVGLGDGNFTRSLAAAGTATGVNFAAGGGGWAAYDADRLVNLGGASAQITWATANTGFNAQTLILGASTATHKVTLENGLDLGNATRTVNVAEGTAAVDGELSGVIIGTTAAATVALDKTGSGVLSLSNANTYTGVTRITGGTLVAGNATAIPGGLATTGGTSAITFNGGVLGLGTGNFTRSLAAAGTITAANFTGAGGWAAFGADRDVNLGGAGATITWTTANTGFNSQTLILGSSGATHTVSLLNPIALGSGTRTVRVDNGSAAVDGIMSGVLSGTAALTVGGGGTLSLTNANNSFNGVVTIGDNTAGTLTVQVNSIKDVSGGNSALGAPTSAANGLIQIGATSNNSTLEFVNLTADQSSNRQVQIGTSGGGSGGAFILNNDADNTVTFSNSAFNVAATGTTSFNRVLRLGGSNTGNNTISGAIINNVGTTGGVVSVTKQDAGKWILSGTNLYSGATRINGGMLKVNGTGSINNSAVTINGGTLSYDSSVAYTGALTFTAGSIGGTNLTGSLGGLVIGTNRTLSPGNSPGIAATTDQTWASGGSYLWEINKADGSAGTDWDLLTGTGTLSITAAAGSEFNIQISSLNLSNAPGALTNFSDSTSTNWLLADFLNPISGFDVTDFSIDTSAFTNNNSVTGSFSVAQGDSPGIGGDSSQLYVTYTVAPVPEPHTALLAGLGLLALLRRRRA